jgi:hypothetical protein
MTFRECLPIRRRTKGTHDGGSRLGGYFGGGKGRARFMVALFRLIAPVRASGVTGWTLFSLVASILVSDSAAAGEIKRQKGLLDSIFSILAPAEASATTSPASSQHASPLFPYDGSSDGPANTEPRSYRTVCVRLCDGYYWPISGSAQMDNFQRDRTSCEASCDQPAQLYYQPSNDHDAAHLISLDGKPYSALPRSFAYRRSIEPSCRCKPDPWSESEIERHRLYAASQAAATEPVVETAPPVAANEGADAALAPIADTDVQAGNPAAEALANDPAAGPRDQVSVDGPVTPSSSQGEQAPAAISSPMQ